MKRTEAGEEAWRRLAVEYPPLPVAAAEEPPADDGTTEVVEPSTGSSPLPASWGEIPESAPFDVEVDWVHQNRVLVVEERSGGASRIHWERARKPTPSYGALGLMEFAVSNCKGFMDILQRTKPALKEDDEENIRRKRSRSTRSMESSNRFRSDATRSCLPMCPRPFRIASKQFWLKWERRFSMTVQNDTRAGLEARIAGLVQKCLDAAGEQELRRPRIGGFLAGVFYAAAAGAFSAS